MDGKSSCTFAAANHNLMPATRCQGARRGRVQSPGQGSGQTEGWAEACTQGAVEPGRELGAAPRSGFPIFSGHPGVQVAESRGGDWRGPGGLGGTVH